jgi:penicillin amidase
MLFIVVGSVIMAAFGIATAWHLRRRKRRQHEVVLGDDLSNDHHLEPLFPTLQPASSLHDQDSGCSCTLFGCWKTCLVTCGILTLTFVSVGYMLFAYASSGRTGPTSVLGLVSNAEVRLSEKGMLHIKAATKHDAFVAQGLLTAEMRLWQMEFQRRVGQGRLAEFVGELALPTDKMMRTLGFYEGAKRSFRDMDADARAALESYTAGVNAYLDSKPTLPLEMQLLGYSNMEPWSPEDSLVWTKLMSFDLSGNVNFELGSLNMLLKDISLNRIEELYPRFNTTRFPTVLTMDDIVKGENPAPTGRLDAVSMFPDASLKKFYEDLQKKVALHREDRLGLNLGHAGIGRLFTTRGASNNWVVGGKMSKSNKPLLCNDPHLQLTAPSIWMMTHLDIEEIGQDLWGASFVGLPGIVIGRNAYIAWGVTNTAVDVQDLYILEENSDKTMYNFQGKMVKYNFTTEVFKVRNGKTETLTVRTTEVGPVITDNGVVQTFRGGQKPESKTDNPYAFPMAFQWVSTDPRIPDTTFMAFNKINQAHNFSEFRDALRAYVAPAQNFIFADRKGNFGYQMPGKIPKRSPGHTGKLPVPAKGNFAWMKGSDGSPYTFMNFDDLPRTYNPPRGFVASANNQVCPTGFEKDGFLLSHDWDASLQGFRSRRITDMIEKKSKSHLLTTEDMRDIQLDYHSGWHEDFSSVFADLQTYHRELHLSDTGKLWAKRLSDFDGNMVVGSTKATVFAKFMIQLARVTDHETGNGAFFSANFLYKTFVGPGDRACSTALEAAGSGISSHRISGWTKERSDCLVYAAKQLEDIVKEGSSAPVSKWGLDVHSARFTNQILHSTPVSCIGDIFVPHGGDSSTVNVGHIDDGEAMVQEEGPSYRQIIQLSELDEDSAENEHNSRFLGPLGQSGDLFSPHYDDLAMAWSTGEYLRMDTSAQGEWDNETIVETRILTPS